MQVGTAAATRAAVMAAVNLRKTDKVCSSEREVGREREREVGRERERMSERERK